MKLIILCLAFAFELRASSLFTDRHSSKGFDPDRAINKQQIEALIEAARWAPSSHNEQPWHLIFCDKYLTPDAYFKALGTFKDKQKKWVENAPLLILIISKQNQRHDNKFNAWADYDTGAAAVSVALQAVNLGLMSHQIGGFDKIKLINEFKLPVDYKPMSIMMIGYEVPYESSKTRTRLPIECNFFWGKWGNGIPL